MREILFRGKAANRKKGYSYRTKYKNGDWVYGLLTDVENYAGFSEMTNTNGVSGIEVDKNTVGQFVGLSDKNGKKIFEGDILSERGSLFAVVYDKKWARFKLQHINRGIQYPEWNRGVQMEIVGNIHDNPELLEG